MGSEKSDNLQTVFLEARQVPANRRANFLEARCGGDEQLRRKVEDLLVAEVGATKAVEHFEPSVRAGLDRFPAIKDYVIIEKLGGGGQADVYKAMYREHITRARSKSSRILPTNGASVIPPPSSTIFKTMRRVVKIQDIGHTAEGKLYLGTDFIGGRTLDEFLHDVLGGEEMKPACC